VEPNLKNGRAHDLGNITSKKNRKGEWEIAEQSFLLKRVLMAFMYEKSATWRWIVRSCRDSKQFFYTFATICGVIPGVIGYM
jgi:hypothetical protein